MITLGVTGVSLHDIKFGVLVSERDGWYHISSQINAKNKNSGKGKRNLEQDEEEEGSDLGNVGGEGIGNGLLQVIEDKTTFLDTTDNGVEVIVKKKHISGVLSDIRTGTHSNTNIGLLNSRRVIDTITSDSDDVTELLASIDNEQFLGRSGSGENDLGLSDPVLDLAALLNLSLGKSILRGVDLSEGITVDNNSLGSFHGFIISHFLTVLVNTVLLKVSVFKLRLGNDVNLSSNSGSGRGLITSNHDDLDTGGLAFLDRDVDLGSGRIVEGNNTNKSKTPHREPTANVRREFLDVFPHLPLFGVKLVLTLDVGLGVEFLSGESEDTLTHTTELVVSSVNISSKVISEINFLTFAQDLGASRKNSLGSTLKENGNIVLLAGRVKAFFVQISDQKVELDVRRERNDGFVTILVFVVGNFDNGEFLSVASNTTKVETFE
mmetsp:Transcript_47293/g.64122  ORF Transcript_47293/g.64122 Transcript_47293/m.64122 type:complete len:436 (+) Transcript_47293:834-2141(+)